MNILQNAGSQRAKKLEYYKRYNAARKEKRKADYWNNRSFILARNKAWCSANKPKRRAACKRYRLRHQEKVKEMRRQYYITHADELKVKRTAYYLRNKECIAAKNRVYHKENYPKNRSRYIEYAKSYHCAHPEQRRKTVSRYHKRHPEVRKLLSSKRRALNKRAKVGDLREMRSFFKSVRNQKNVCAYCRVPLSVEEVTIDHVIPLTRGGKHEVANLAVACLRCNSSKGNKLLSEWVPLNHILQTTPLDELQQDSPRCWILSENGQGNI